LLDENADQHISSSLGHQIHDLRIHGNLVEKWSTVSLFSHRGRTQSPISTGWACSHFLPDPLTVVGLPMNRHFLHENTLTSGIIVIGVFESCFFYSPSFGLY
jgi:hypothetical protein